MADGDDESRCNEKTPLWKYVTREGKSKGGGGNKKFKCNICQVSYRGSYSRVKAHLLKIRNDGIRICPKVTVGLPTEMLKLENDAQIRKESGQAKSVPFSSSVSTQSSSYPVSMDSIGQPSFKQEGYEPTRKRKCGDPALEKSFNLQAREQLDCEIARMFYSAGLPFNLAKNPHFINAFNFAANNKIAGYTPPGYNALRTKLLEKEISNIDSLLESSKSTWKEKGVTIVSDGWTDPQRRPLINFMAINEGGPMFLRAINCQGHVKDKHFISNLMKDVISEVGSANVVQIITDNAPVCRAAGLLVEQAYPNIFWTPCVVHTLNLALKNICASKNTEANGITYAECHWITEIVQTAVMMRNFIMNHSMRLAMFNEFSKLKLLVVAETRFASMIIMLRRFKEVKEQLQAMVISRQWSLYRDDDFRKANTVRQTLLDETWWDLVDYILTFTDPIYLMLRRCDTDKACLHLVYEMWDTMILQVKKAIFKHEGKNEPEESSFWNVVHQILEDRWNKSGNALHCLAYSLNPRCTTEQWKKEHPHFTPPKDDIEVSKMRSIGLKCLFASEDVQREANVELAKFFGLRDYFADPDSIRDRWEMDPLEWWLIYGNGAPHLKSICTKLLGQVSSSSCCERNWSTYGFIHSTKRNQITPQRADSLVFVHSNLRLLLRKTPQYMKGDSKMWDVAGDAYDDLDDVGLLGIASLTLDEPELESSLVVDEANEGSSNECDASLIIDD